MDAIRKKMQSMKVSWALIVSLLKTFMKVEIDDMYNKCKEYEDATKEANNASDKNDIDIRDVGKKVQKMETKMEEILEQLQASNSKMEQLDAEYKDKEEVVNAQSRRVLLLESECSIQIEKLATTVLKLALMSKDADNIVKGCRHWESKVRLEWGMS